MHWIYLSPHLDDAALSVGGLLWEQSQAGNQVSIWTICAGDPPSGDFSAFAESLQTRWETGAQSMPARRAEDIESCRRLGAGHLHFNIPDCIYRRSPVSGKHLYDSEAALWLPVHPDEEMLVDKITARIAEELPPVTRLVCPLTLGNHVDHRLTRSAAARLGVNLSFYADYPYVLQAQNLEKLEKRSSSLYPVSEPALLAWQNAVAAHRSQLSTFWDDLEHMRASIREYCQLMGGVRLFS